jgi:hypothetical protein
MLSKNLLEIINKFAVKNSAAVNTFLRILLVGIVSLCMIVFGISMLGIGSSLHHDEWVGRGLYPGLALANGFDLYEPRSGPHVTLYGWGNAIFYSPAFIGNNPVQVIWIAFFLNLLAFSVPLTYLASKCYSQIKLGLHSKTLLLIISILAIFAICGFGATTEGIYRIHADISAYFYILVSVCLFLKYMECRKYIILYLTSLFLILALWTKITVLPAIFFPVIILFCIKNFRDLLLYIIFALASFLLTLGISSLAFGFDDLITILFDHIAPSLWSDRSSLFDGSNAILVDMSYLEATPLLFRFFVMYLADFWYLFIPCIVIFISSLKLIFYEDRFFLILTSLYFLLLPPCLAALAHSGGVENSLFFTNVTACICVILFFSTSTLRAINSKVQHSLIFAFLTLLLLLPTLRESLGSKKDPKQGHHQIAYDYLVEGNEDVYFGWFPISHLLYSGNNVTCIEVPTWGAYSLFDVIDFSLTHFPENAKYLATGPGGFGSIMLRRYIGELEEIKPLKSLPGWRLYKPVAESQK